MADDKRAEAQAKRQVSSTKPTIGRKVWVWVGGDEGYTVYDDAQALDGTVIFVNGDGTINVAIQDHAGNCTTKRNVELYDPDELSTNHGPLGSDGVYATWMPYQKTQHDKQATASGSAASAGAKVPTPTSGATEQSRPPAPGAAARAPVENLNAGGTEARTQGTQAAPGGASQAGKK